MWGDNSNFVTKRIHIPDGAVKNTNRVSETNMSRKTKSNVR